MGKQKDMLWKGVLDQMFEDFLPFLNPDLAMSFDLQRGFEFMDKELNHEFPSINGVHEQKIVDKLIKLYTKEGNPVLMHLEVQDKYSKDFSQRMYNYFNRLYDKYKMPIVAYAIFTEPNEIKRTDTFSINYMGTDLNYKFNTYKIASQDDASLIQHPNPFALIILIAKATALKALCRNSYEYDERLLAYKLKIARLIGDMKLPGQKERMIMNFLFYYINFEFPETKSIFDQKVNLLINKNIKGMTIEEILLEDAELTGFLRGQSKTWESMVWRCIVKAGLSDDEIVELVGAPLDFVKMVRINLNIV